MPADARDLTGVRASTAVRCPRAAVYQHHDAPRRQWTDTELRWFKRGQGWHDVVLGQIVEEFNAQGRRPRREELVPWPASDPVGVGHADLYIPSDRLVVEVVSNAGANVPEAKILQAALYALEHPNAEHASVLAVDTHSGEERVLPIDLSGVEARIRSIEEQVVAGCRDGEIPGRVCQTPLDGPAHMCPFVDHCFADWTWPEMDELLADPGDVLLLADAEDEVGALRSEVKTAETKRNALRDRLRPFVPAGGEGQAGDVRVRRTVFASASFSLSDARKAGHELPAHLEPFAKESQQERWTVKRGDQ